MAVKDNLLPKCVICGFTPYKGIHGGILIGKNFLCSSCERAIVQLKSDDDYYQYYINRLKKMWA
ncbi:MAG: sigma factor G inhibitor Gin [Bacillota bacterium]|jgi:hypothetical protein